MNLLPETRLSITVPRFVAEALQAVAKQSHLSRAELVREALREFAPLRQQILKSERHPCR